MSCLQVNIGWLRGAILDKYSQAIADAVIQSHLANVWRQMLSVRSLRIESRKIGFDTGTSVLTSDATFLPLPSTLAELRVSCK